MRVGAQLDFSYDDMKYRSKSTYTCLWTGTKFLACLADRATHWTQDRISITWQRAWWPWQHGGQRAAAFEALRPEVARGCVLAKPGVLCSPGLGYLAPEHGNKHNTAMVVRNVRARKVAAPYLLPGNTQKAQDTYMLNVESI